MFKSIHAPGEASGAPVGRQAFEDSVTRVEGRNNVLCATPLQKCVVRFSGDLDMANRACMKALLDRLDADVVIIDLSKASFLDAGALGCFVRLKNRLRESCRLGIVRIVVPNPRLRRLFEITGLTKAFDLHESFDSARIARP
jgi:anti-anti-sigma factor